MEPIEDTSASAAGANPPAPAAAFLSGPKIVVLSPLPGNRFDADRYFYSPVTEVTEGDYTALFTFAAHYGHPLAIYQCPDIAAVQVSHPLAIIRPFSEVPPPILQWGHKLQSSLGASPASQSGGLALASLLSYSSSQGSSWGHDLPSITAATRASSTAISRNASLPPPPCHPNPDGVDDPSSVSRRMGGMRSPCFVGRSSSSYGFFPLKIFFQLRFPYYLHG